MQEFVDEIQLFRMNGLNTRGFSDFFSHPLVIAPTRIEVNALKSHKASDDPAVPSSSTAAISNLVFSASSRLALRLMLDFKSDLNLLIAMISFSVKDFCCEKAENLYKI